MTEKIFDYYECDFEKWEITEDQIYKLIKLNKLEEFYDITRS